MRRFILKSELAYMEEISKARVSQLIAEKVIIPESDGRLDLRKVNQQLAGWRQKRMKRRCEHFEAPGLEGIDFEAALASLIKTEEE